MMCAWWQVFLGRVSAHPVLKEAPELSTFLLAGEEEWSMEMARWQVRRVS